MPRWDYRRHLPAQGKSRIAGHTAADHTSDRLATERAQRLIGEWSALGEAPFKGITADGSVQRGLFELRDEGAPAAEMASTAIALLERLSPADRKRAHFAVESEHWRKWQNTEMVLEDHGVRLDAAGAGIRESVISLLEACLSTRGAAKVRGAMRLNGFLGDLLGAQGVLGEWSYTVCLFGNPSAEQPWGWQLFGHHLCLNCMVIGGQMTLSPCLLGAEIVEANRGPHSGMRLFEDEERKGLALMQSLAPALRERAQVFKSNSRRDLPDGRWHYADHLHLGGAHHDNRIVPYEGLRASKMPGRHQHALLDLVQAHLDPLPAGPLARRMTDMERHLAETRFCWIGGIEADSTFYYRVQSPVVFIEFDHHSGVFLTNPEPEQFHVHTIVRTPNGNDYGFDLLRQHYLKSEHHAGSGSA